MSHDFVQVGEEWSGRLMAAVSAVMQTLYQSVTVKTELTQKQKLITYWSVYVSTPSYGRGVGSD